MNNKNDKIKKLMTRIIMFISSYFPLYIMIIILYYSKILKGLEEHNSRINSNFSSYFHYQYFSFEMRERD